MRMAHAKIQDIGYLDLFVCQVMDAVGIVPIEPEIGRRGLHRRQPFDGRVGINCSRRIAVFRNAPHALDGSVIGYEPLNLVHVRTIFPKRHRDHPDAVILANPEVPVVAGYGAQEGNLTLF
jgi:hypothetical protein